MFWFLGIGFSLCLLGRLAAAETAVVEAKVFNRSLDVTALLAPLLEELSSRGTVNGDALSPRWEARASFPIRDRGGLRATFVEEVEVGYKQWLGGNFEACLAALEPLVDEAHHNPAGIAADARLGAALYKSLVALSLCHQRLGDFPASRAAIAELLRSFDLEVDKAQFGVEARELFMRARFELRSEPSSALNVRALDEDVALFINERFAGVGHYARAGLLPGRYRVFAQGGKLQSRLHIIEVKPGENATLEFDPQLECLTGAAPDRIAFTFSNYAQRDKHEIAYALLFGASISVDAVILVGITEQDGQMGAYGAFVDVAQGRVLRRASIAMSSPSLPQLQRALARFLLGEPAIEGIHVSGRVALAAAPPAASPAHRWNGWKWVAAGGAVASLGVGVGLLHPYDYQTGGPILIGTGVALGGVATWLWLSSPRRTQKKFAFWALPWGDGAHAGVAAHW